MLNDPLNISFTGLHSTEIAKQRRTLDIHMRNMEIRAKYRELRGRGLTAGDAKGELAEAYNLARDTIDSIGLPILLKNFVF